MTKRQFIMSEDRAASTYEDEERDYLNEAEAILSGTTRLLTQKEHLIALNEFYAAKLNWIEKKIQEIIKR